VRLPESLERLIAELSRLPGVGPKTAQRLAFWVLRADRDRVAALAAALTEARDRVGQCRRCFNIAEGPLCEICSSARRDGTVICVVEAPLDVLAIERTGEYRGMYFVLNGVLSPIDDVGPEELHVPALLDWVGDAGAGVEEVIVATNPDIEGEATAVYLHRALSPLVARVTRPAHGLPFGGDLEYADEMTVARAMSGRRAL
jgi:recombination protein RecR